MIARMAIWKLKKGNYGAFLEHMRESSSIIRSHAGIKGLMMLHSNKEPDSAISITFWETEAQSDDSRQDPGFQDAIKSMQYLLEAPPELRVYDVDGLEMILQNFK